jgi:hypothetical protein
VILKTAKYSEGEPIFIQFIKPYIMKILTFLALWAIIEIAETIYKSSFKRSTVRQDILDDIRFL